MKACPPPPRLLPLHPEGHGLGVSSCGLTAASASVRLHLHPCPGVLVCWEPERLPVTPGVEVMLGVILRRPSARAWVPGGTQGQLLRLLWQLVTSIRALREPLM